MSERCKVCDRPEATQDDWDTVPEGEGENLCWDETQCRSAAVDWRERALCAERQVAAVRDVLEGVARLRDEYSYKPFRVEESPFARGLDIAMDRLTRALETE